MPRKGRSNQEIVHALHQAESGEQVGLNPRSAHPVGDRPKKPEASRTLHPGGVGADDLPSEPTPGREACPRAAQYVAVRLASENGRVRDQSRGSHLTPRGCG